MTWLRALNTPLQLLLALSLSAVVADTPSELDDQRAIFTSAYTAAEHGQWSLSANETRLMRDYVLWPDLRGKFFEKNLSLTNADTVDEFLARYDGTPAARSLRYKWSQYLVRNKAWTRFLALYDSHYAKLGQTVLDCQAVHAQIGANQTVNGALALQLWRVGKSQPDACDAVFTWLSDNDMLDEVEIRTRYDLSLARGDYNLAAWLAKRLDAEARTEAKQWQQLRDAPQSALKARSLRADNANNRRKLAYGLYRLARIKTDKGVSAWTRLEERFVDHPEEANAVREKIALLAAWRHEPEAGELMASVAPEYRGDELQEWRVRAALRDGDWVGVAATVSELSDDLAATERWQYWKARARLKLGEPEIAAQTFEALAQERSYYGFLAADQLGSDYAFGHTGINADPEILAELQKNPALIRARELFLVGLTGRARSEWDAHTRKLPGPRKQQAALLAHQWGWHSRAIASIASAGNFDDLELRYPLPWQPSFDRYSDSNQIPAEWAYSIARSESLFMQDVRSRAGAVGLMQLMPATGRETAKKEKIRFRGVSSLTDAKTNIRLGTRYLADMSKRFNDNTVLATAAYNAGPHRVDRWVANVDQMSADIWIETIPYDETRGYVQRVLSAQAVFHWRLNNAQQRLTKTLRTVQGPVSQARRNNSAGAPSS